MLKIENHFSFYENKTKVFNARNLAELKEEYEAKDWEIFHSNWRKNQGYIPHGTRERTITTIFGDLTYSRHRYRYWDEYRYRFVYLSDLELGINRYERATNHLKIKIIEKIAEGKRYRDILDCFPAINLTTRTISNIVSSANLNSLSDVLLSTNLQKSKIEKCLYINVDDTFLTLKEKGLKKKFRVRVVLFNTGYDQQKSTPKKKVLKNVRFYAFILRHNSKFDTQTFMEKVYALSNQFYSNVEDSKVIISGDGASWIRKCSSYWPGSIYILDKFHAVRNIANVFNPKSEDSGVIYREAIDLFFKGDFSRLMNLINNQSFVEKYQKNKLSKLKSYFNLNEKQAKGLSNQSDDDNIGCNIESAISHHVKWLLGYGSKAFSRKVFSKMLDIHIAKVNGISIISLFKEQIFKVEKEKISFFRESYWKKTRGRYYSWGETDKDIFLDSRKTKSWSTGLNRNWI